MKLTYFLIGATTVVVIVSAYILWDRYMFGVSVREDIDLLPDWDSE